MTNLRRLSVISVRENLVSNVLYFLINKLSTAKWIATFADKKSTIHLSSKGIKPRCMVLFRRVHFIVKIVRYFFEVKKIWDIILPTNIKWYIKSLQFICENFNPPGKADIAYLLTNRQQMLLMWYVKWNTYIFSQSIKYIFKLFLSHKSYKFSQFL